MMNNKILTQNRIKSVVMWVGMIATALLSIGINWQDWNSWQAIGNALLSFISDPARIVAFVVCIYSIANNPTNKEGF